MAQNVKLMQEAALVDPNRGTGPGPTKIYEDLKLEISSQPCPKLREQIVKDFIRSNPNVHNMKHLRQQIGYFVVSSLYKWRNEIHNPAQVQPMVPAYAQVIARNTSRHPSCLLSHARQLPQPYELAIDSPRYFVGEYPKMIGQTGQHPSISCVTRFV
jgi:hypothetical protein